MDGRVRLHTPQILLQNSHSLRLTNANPDVQEVCALAKRSRGSAPSRMDSNDNASYPPEDPEGGQSVASPGDTESIGDANCLQWVMLLVRWLGNRRMQVQLGDELWKTTCKPLAQFIVQSRIVFLMFIFREACFGGKPHSSWVYIGLMLIQLVVVFSLTHSLIALVFSTIMTSKQLCWLVLLSLLWLMVGIIVGVITSTILMAKAYLASLA